MTNDEIEIVARELELRGRSWADQAAALLRRLRDERDQARTAFDVRETAIATIRDEYHAAAIQRDEARNKALDEAAEACRMLENGWMDRRFSNAILALKTQEPKPS